MIQAVKNPINRLLKPQVSSTDLGWRPGALEPPSPEGGNDDLIIAA